MNTLIIASFTSLLSLSAVADSVYPETIMITSDTPVSTEISTKTSSELRAEIEIGIQAELQQYTAQLSTLITQQAQQELFATAANLLILNSAEHKTELATLVPQMLLLAKKLAASTLNGE
ncbi:hypothetical protein [Rheinheimera sp. MMS21-TC3]|uniref:hypothetical protein n=1 Tax=Rheinheimera sp. MMS21-TC3 TaxID=3072790 RepID=UPI0028C38F57|nr:hypothetical protein [Rheinheimera sp. MMS21-TC3]WNO60506.1 hypothetical protein RDV63_05935 [Rheinheimera sp. MMS21-TC3]